MTKQTLEYASDEKMASIDAGLEMELDIRAGTQAYEDKYAERIEFLKHHLWDVTGRITQFRPHFNEWPQERMEELQNLITHAWHYRQEIRLLTVLARGEHDATDRVAEWAFFSDRKFGPLPDKVALIN